VTSIGFAVYVACVDFLLALARLCGFTYRDANALLFFVVWPVTTLVLAAWWTIERALLRRALRHEGGVGLRYPHR
jgi:hypothetical protein